MAQCVKKVSSQVEPGLARIERIGTQRRFAKVDFMIYCADTPLTIDDAYEGQRELGYPPHLHGCFGFECVEDLPGLYTATWQCWRDADESEKGPDRVDIDTVLWNGNPSLRGGK